MAWPDLNRECFDASSRTAAAILEKLGLEPQVRRSMFRRVVRPHALGSVGCRSCGNTGSWVVVWLRCPALGRTGAEVRVSEFRIPGNAVKSGPTHGTAHIYKDTSAHVALA